MKPGIKFSVLWFSLFVAAGAEAAVFDYTGTITDGTEPLVLIMPVGSGLNGVFNITSPGAGMTSENPMIMNSIEISMTDAVTGATTFCFRYNAMCGPGQAVVDIAQISLFLVFNTFNEPASGIIELTIFTPTTAPVLAIFDLTNDNFLIRGAFPGLGEVSGDGSFNTTPVPLPASLWFLISAVALLAPVAVKKRYVSKSG